MAGQDPDTVREKFAGSVNTTAGEPETWLDTDDDLDHMRKVRGYVQHHLAQEPDTEDVENSRWRYSLMNWSHDPLKTS